MASPNAQSPNYRSPSQRVVSRLVVRDEIAFQKQLAAQLASERSFTLGLFPTHELPGFAAESQAGDLYEDTVVDASGRPHTAEEGPPDSAGPSRASAPASSQAFAVGGADAGGAAG